MEVNVERWWSDTGENVLLATCYFVIRTRLYNGLFARRVKYPQVTDVCHMYQCHPTVRWADWIAVLTCAAPCSVCSSVR